MANSGSSSVGKWAAAYNHLAVVLVARYYYDLKA